MIINKWGSYGWIFFHAIAYQWEGEWFEEKVGIKFFENIGKFLPCPGCIAHYDKNYKNLEMSLIDAVKNKLSLGKWLVMLHNSVSKWQNNDSYTMKFLKYKKPMINDIQAKDMHKNTDWLVCWWYFMFAIAGTYRDSIPPAYEKLITLKNEVSYSYIFFTFNKEPKHKYKQRQIDKHLKSSEKNRQKNDSRENKDKKFG